MHRLGVAVLLAGAAVSTALVANCGPGTCCGAMPDSGSGNACNTAGVAVCTRAATCTDGGVTLLWSSGGAYDNEGFGNGATSAVGGCEFWYTQGCELFPDSGTFDASACIAVAPSLVCGDGGLVLTDECHEPQH